MGRPCDKFRKITYQRAELRTDIQRINDNAFLVVESVTGKDDYDNEYHLIFSGAAQRILQSDLFKSNTSIVVNRHDKSANLTVKDVVNENYRSQVGKYKEVPSGNKLVIVDEQLGFVCVRF